MLALSGEQTTTRVCRHGANGEERLARCLDPLVSDDVAVLHDRKIPGSRANIDHIIVPRRGIWVIDAKSHRRRVSRSVDGWLVGSAPSGYWWRRSGRACQLLALSGDPRRDPRTVRWASRNSGRFHRASSARETRWLEVRVIALDQADQSSAEEQVPATYNGEEIDPDLASFHSRGRP